MESIIGSLIMKVKIANYVTMARTAKMVKVGEKETKAGKPLSGEMPMETSLDSRSSNGEKKSLGRVKDIIIIMVINTINMYELRN
jgi:hypothetical protein